MVFIGAEPSWFNWRSGRGIQSVLYMAQELKKGKSQNRSDMRDKESESVACTMHRIVYVRAQPKNNHQSIQFSLVLL